MDNVTGMQASTADAESVIPLVTGYVYIHVTGYQWNDWLGQICADIPINKFYTVGFLRSTMFHEIIAIGWIYEYRGDDIDQIRIIYMGRI